MGDGPFNQLSDTKLTDGESEHKSITAQFFKFSFYRIARTVTIEFLRMFPIIKIIRQFYF